MLLAAEHAYTNTRLEYVLEYIRTTRLLYPCNYLCKIEFMVTCGKIDVDTLHTLIPQCHA